MMEKNVPDQTGAELVQITEDVETSDRQRGPDAGDCLTPKFDAGVSSTGEREDECLRSRDDGGSLTPGRTADDRQGGSRTGSHIERNHKHHWIESEGEQKGCTLSSDNEITSERTGGTEDRCCAPEGPDGRQMGDGTAPGTLVGTGHHCVNPTETDGHQTGGGTASEVKTHTGHHCFYPAESDGRQTGGGTASARKRESGGGNSSRTEDDTDGHRTSGGTASENRRNTGGCSATECERESHCRQLKASYGDPAWVRLCRTSHDSWDPGGASRGH